jgi:hypothetical protein
MTVNVNNNNFKMIYTGNEYNVLKLMTGEQTFSLRDRFTMFVISCKEFIGMASGKESAWKEFYDQVEAINEFGSNCVRLLGATKFAKEGEHTSLLANRIVKVLGDKEEIYHALTTVVKMYVSNINVSHSSSDATSTDSQEELSTDSSSDVITNLDVKVKFNALITEFARVAAVKLKA